MIIDTKGKRGEPLPPPNEGLPDSYRPSGLCPRCGKQSSFERLGDLPVTFGECTIVDQYGRSERETLDRVSSLRCRHCEQALVVIEELWIGDFASRDARRSGGGPVSFQGFHWWPTPETRISNDVPLPIADAFLEATRAQAARCPRAAAAMARRTIEAIAADKGETAGVLAVRLERLAANGVLQPTLAEWAKEVRLVGNTGVHFDLIDDVSLDDAAQLIAFVRELLHYLYELPAELSRHRSGK